VADGVTLTFIDAGHILGSAQVVLDLVENGHRKRLLFSGDVGRGNNELLAIVALPFALRPKREAVKPTDDAVVIVTPHNEAIRYEYARGFGEWYRAKTGRTVAVDWRMVGGTSEIARFLEGEYVAGFEQHWVRRLGRPWSGEVQAGIQNCRVAADAPGVSLKLLDPRQGVIEIDVDQLAEGLANRPQKPAATP
jgi:hypothetical protein